MKRKFFPLFKDEGEVVASWGQAQLTEYLDGKLELRGGSDQNRAEAREWMSLFWHEAVVGDGSGGGVEIVVDLNRQGFKVESRMAEMRMQPRAV